MEKNNGNGKSDLTKKIIGDGGEYYALSQFIFAGHAAAKMPDNWPSYDLVVSLNGTLKTVSVKTRFTSKDTFTTEHCKFDREDKDKIDFIVFIFKTKSEIHSWVVPSNEAYRLGEARSTDPNYRRLSFKQLSGEPLSQYKDDWPLEKS